jgi:hypothetical protein
VIGSDILLIFSEFPVTRVEGNKLDFTLVLLMVWGSSSSQFL